MGYALHWKEMREVRRMPFMNRVDAGWRLARVLEHLRGEDLVVLGLPRGGVPVALEVAKALGAPLDVIVVRKLGVPFQPELAMGAIGEDGVRLLNSGVLCAAGIDAPEIAAIERVERVELERRVRRLRGDRPRVSLTGRIAIVVDDGMATGASAAAACRVARAQGARSVIVAVPVAAPEAVDRVREDANDVVCLQTPKRLHAVGQWYADFRQTTDEEVAALLASAPVPVSQVDPDPPGRDEQVEIPAGGVLLGGRLTVPDGADGVVVFAHGSGSSRFSPRNQFVAAGLNQAGLGTLLLDLLAPAEEANRDTVFDVRLLASRLRAATEWLRDRHSWIGYFGASTGAAAALWAAAEPHAEIAAVVSRGGRPDLALSHLGLVTAPTLLIVGGEDRDVLALNRRAQAALHCENSLAVVPGATHLFEEPGALAEVVRLAAGWFTKWAGGPDARSVH